MPKFLVRAGYSTTISGRALFEVTAKDGTEALKKAKTGRYDELTTKEDDDDGQNFHWEGAEVEEI